MAEPRTEVHRRVDVVLERLRGACERSGRDPASVTLVGASKRHDDATILAAHEAGVRVFGENRVQEALAKAAALPATLEWHLIGPLQTNKARMALGIFRTIHSIDRPKVARFLDHEAERLDVEVTGLLEVNVGEEPTKHGFEPKEVRDGSLDELATLPRLSICGLMTIPPRETDPERSRAWFRRLRELRDELFERPAWSDRPGWLSMGMSLDFEIAIEEGATHVRVGTALFGPRS